MVLPTRVVGRPRGNNPLLGFQPNGRAIRAGSQYHSVSTYEQPWCTGLVYCMPVWACMYTETLSTIGLYIRTVTVVCLARVAQGTCYY